MLAGSPLLFAALAVSSVAAAAVGAAQGNLGSHAPSKATATATTTMAQPCTASSTSGAFYDLRGDIAVVPAKGTKPRSGVHTTDYTARGHDYGANFTLNICAPVVKPVTDLAGVDADLWRNVSAYYRRDGQVFSLGLQSSALVSRGRELVLQYKGGSPCPAPVSARSLDHGSYDMDRETAAKAASLEPEAVASSSSSSLSDPPIRRKSATFSFLCDRDPMDNAALVSFVGTPDDCAYFFKIRSQHACATAEPHKPGSVGPGGVFAIIFGVALLVYFIGGVVYQRTVGHARGWRQLPNYALWAGIWSFVRDFAIILTSSCTRYMPARRGYQTLSVSPSTREDENRLIDQLDEEWDD